MKRNRGVIKSGRGQKYELDRASWTTNTNFKDMYLHDYEEMVASGVSGELEVPLWQDKVGNVVSKENVYGCKVTHELTNLDYCIVLDEVGSNIN